jgi:hypothetical protein
MSAPLDAAPLVAFVLEREAIRIKKGAGQPPPWTDDPILQEWSFTNVHREHDRTTIWVRENWREPHADDPDLWFAMAVARFVNWPDTLAEVGFPVPWDPGRFLAIMADRKVRGETVYNGAYRIRPPGKKEKAAGFNTTAAYQAARVFTPLWDDRGRLRPQPGWRLEQFHNRLAKHHGLGDFTVAQVVADIKHVAPLREAADWQDFVAPGPGSQLGLTFLTGIGEVKKNPRGDWLVPYWDKYPSDFRQLVRKLRDQHINPALTAAGYESVDAQDAQNCLCEFSKYYRLKEHGATPKRRYFRGGVHRDRAAPAAINNVPAIIAPDRDQKAETAPAPTSTAVRVEVEPSEPVRDGVDGPKMPEADGATLADLAETAAPLDEHRAQRDAGRLDDPVVAAPRPIAQAIACDAVAIELIDPAIARLPDDDVATERPDVVTVLTTHGPLMTKRISRGAAGEPILRDYDDAKHFDMASAEIRGVDDLAAKLDNLTARQCVVLGRVIDGVETRNVRRLLYPDSKTGEPATLESAPHYWLPIDLDAVDCPAGLDPIGHPEDAVDHVVAELMPAELRGVDVYWQLTSGAGFKPGIRLRLVFWCDRELTGAEMKRWLGRCPGVDASIYTANQPIYFAKPIFEGIDDPVPRRSGIRRGVRRLVSPPEAIPEASRLNGGSAGSTTIGYKAWCSRIGDHDAGEGFFEPIKRAVASWVATNSAGADTGWLRRDLEQVIRAAPRDPGAHPDAYIETRVRDLGTLIPWVVARQATEEVERKPELRVRGGDLPEVAREIGRMLARTGRIFVRDVPAKVVLGASGEAPTAVALSANGVVIETHRLAQPVTWKAGRKDETGEWVATTLPERVAALYLDMRDEWNLPALDGIATAPLLAEDGAIRAPEGYDPASRLWCCRVPVVAVPDRPAQEQAAAALRTLRDIFRTFPFGDAERRRDKELGVEVVDLNKPIGHDESAALMALLTAICRPSLWLAPGLVVTAPEMSGAGTGKGLLVRAICEIAFGVRPRAFTGGHDSAELDKRIVAEAIKAVPALLLDNVNGAVLLSDTLACLMTERPASVRILGESRMVEFNSASFVSVTGNGLSISEDLARRFLSCVLDAGIEDPEQRPFRPGFLDEVARRRSEVLSAALTIWRWGRQNAAPRGKPLGSFEVWAEWVRDPLLALGCRDPVERIEATKATDPRRQNVAELFELWWRYHGADAIKAKDLAADVEIAIDPHQRGRQYVARRLVQLSGTRAAGFVLTRQEAAGKWGAATYQLESTVLRVVGNREPKQGDLPYDDTPPPLRYEGP